MRVVILDGYTDEPAGLGVPPYIDVYARYIAGAVWAADPRATVYYYTIDEARRNFSVFIKRAVESDFLIVIAGVVVPGRYLGGRPLTLEELLRLPRIITGPRKVLVGPAARFGFWESGKRVVSAREIAGLYDVVVRGDAELVVYEIMRRGVESVNPFRVRRNYELTSKFAVLGARIVLQHPNHGLNLIAEIETFRGCARWVSGGCSFCIEPRYGRVQMRPVESIVDEVRALYALGVRGFRLGRQSDILVYGSREVNYKEFPSPNPEALNELFMRIRGAAPSVRVLHVDNANPMTIALHAEAAEMALRAILRWHTPGDVLAFGVESVDPVVIRENNLGVEPEAVLEAVRIANRVGSKRGWNGFPELLPGLNFVLGLLGETRDTLRRNKEFLERILREKLLVRRVNIREVAVLEGTRLSSIKKWSSPARRNYRGFKLWVRRSFDTVMMRRLFPKGLVLRRLYVEGYSEDGRLYARPPASYPVTVFLEEKAPLWSVVDVEVTGYGARSLRGRLYRASRGYK